MLRVRDSTMLGRFVCYRFPLLSGGDVHLAPWCRDKPIGRGCRRRHQERVFRPQNLPPGELRTAVVATVFLNTLVCHGVHKIIKFGTQAWRPKQATSAVCFRYWAPRYGDLRAVESGRSAVYFRCLDPGIATILIESDKSGLLQLLGPSQSDPGSDKSGLLSGIGAPGIAT